MMRVNASILHASVGEIRIENISAAHYGMAQHNNTNYLFMNRIKTPLILI